MTMIRTFVSAVVLMGGTVVCGSDTIAPLPSPQTISRFRLNHVGFRPEAKKTFVIADPADEHFQLWERREDVEFHLVFEGDLARKDSDLPGEWVGDFSDVKKEGIYRLRCGKIDSRCFVIWSDVYDAPMRTLLTYFTWQRCGHQRGWAGECHLDDGVLKETGERKDFTGGFHQSCDLRKSLDGVAIGLIGLTRYALLQHPHWDDGDIAEEIRWGCDYYRKLISPDGFMDDGLFVPFGWAGREYHNTPAPWSEQWNSIIFLSLGSQYFQKHGDQEYADQCAAGAKRIWQYMISDKRPSGAYVPPEPPPRGLRVDKFYAQVYTGSAADLAFRVCAAAELYRATGERPLLAEVETSANRLCDLQVNDGDLEENLASACFRESPGSEYLTPNGSYIWATGGPLAFMCGLGSPSRRKRCRKMARLFAASRATVAILSSPERVGQNSTLLVHRR